MTPEQIASNVSKVIINPLLLLLFAIGLLVFIFGVVEFLVGLSTESDKKKEGKKHMLYGLIGMFIMVAAFSIIRLIASTVCNGGLQNCYH